jgi:acyl-coenzyme A synthetase/AMP-(fatty) acid ligase/acyl carrier protein
VHTIRRAGEWVRSGLSAINASDTAIAWSGGSLSYNSLLTCVSQLTAALEFVSPGTVLSGRFRRGEPAAIVACLAAWELGAVPIFQDADASRWLADKAYSEVGASVEVTMLTDEAGDPPLTPLPVMDAPGLAGSLGYRRLPNVTSADIVGDSEACYIVATSGSTGQRRFCLNRLSGLMNTVDELIKRYRIRRTSASLQFAPCNYDAFLADVLPTLFAGGTVICGHGGGWSGFRHLARDIETLRPTHLVAPPSVWRHVLPMEHKFEVAISAGESLDPATARIMADSADVVVNAYGLSEAAICTTTYQVQGDEEAIPLGQPLDGTRLAVLTDDGRVTPSGEGRLRIYGAGVGYGYVGGSEKPALADTVWFGQDESLGRFVQTADRVSIDGGTVIFVARSDRCIKRHGRLISLDTIENAVRAVPGVSECTAWAEGDQITCEYLTEVGSPEPAGLLTSLGTMLEPWERPGAVVRVEELKRNASDKLDRRGPLSTASQVSRPEPLDTSDPELSAAVAKIWISVLKSLSGSAADDADMSGSFFAAGGDSTAAMVLLDQIAEVFHIDIDIADFSVEPTPQYLCSLIATEAARA